MKQHLQNIGFLFSLGYRSLASSLATISIVEGVTKKRVEIPKRLVDDTLRFLNLKNDPNRRRWVRSLIKAALEAKSRSDRMKLADKWGMKFIARYANQMEVTNFIRFVRGKWEKHTGIKSNKVVKKALVGPSSEVKTIIKKTRLSKKKQAALDEQNRLAEEKKAQDKKIVLFDEVADFKSYIKDDLREYINFTGQIILEEAKSDGGSVKYILIKYAKPKELNLNYFAKGLYGNDWEGSYGEEIHAPVELLIKARNPKDWEKVGKLKSDPMAVVPIREAYQLVMSNKRFVQDVTFTKKYSDGQDVPFLYIKTKGDSSSLISMLRDIKGVQVMFISTPKKEKSKRFTFTYSETYIKAIIGISTLVPTGDFGKRVIGEVYCKFLINVPTSVIKEYFGLKTFKITDPIVNKFGRTLVKMLK